MKNPLNTLDEIVLAQFEKVTQYTHKKYGWDKYNLVDVTAKFGSSTYIIAGGYDIGSSFFGSGPVFAALGLVQIGLGYLGLKFLPKFNKIIKKEELRLLVETGATRPPKIDPLRPLWLGYSTGMVGAYGYRLYDLHQSLKVNLNVPNYDSKAVLYLSVLTGGVALFTLISMNYFRNTTMTPPATKKNPVKVLYEKVKTALLPDLQKEPVTVPVSMPVSVNYQSD